MDYLKTFTDLYIYGTGLDSIIGHEISITENKGQNKEQISLGKQRMYCLGFTVLHLSGIVVSPLISIGGCLAALAAPIFTGIAMIKSHSKELSFNEQCSKAFKILCGLELIAIGGIASPILHTAATVRSLAGTLLTPNLYIRNASIHDIKA